MISASSLNKSREWRPFASWAALHWFDESAQGRSPVDEAAADKRVAERMAACRDTAERSLLTGGKFFL